MNLFRRVLKSLANQLRRASIFLDRTAEPLATEKPNPDFEHPSCHLIVSQMNNAIWIKPTRKVSRIHLAGLVSQASFMLASSDCEFIHPEDCRLKAFLTVDDSQTLD